MIGRPSNSKLKFKSGSSGYSIIIMTSFFSHFPLISTKRTLEVIESAEKDTISNESENSRPTKENPQNSNDLVIGQSILRTNSPLPSNSTDSNSISDTSATSCQTSVDKDTESPEMKDKEYRNQKSGTCKVTVRTYN